MLYGLVIFDCKQVRTHLSLNKNAPLFSRSQNVGNIATFSILGGLHHHYVRV